MAVDAENCHRAGGRAAGGGGRVNGVHAKHAVVCAVNLARQ
jgi:hypothetical protein